MVTGANGFVGRAIMERAAGFEEMQLSGTVRFESQRIVPKASKVVTGELSARTDWSGWLREVDVVVHTVARAHVTRDRSENPLSEFRRVNSDVTLGLARACAAAGVRRFIFVSSIGVNGKETFGVPFTPEDIPRPTTPYALSKMEAEDGLRQVASETGLEVVVIRPPLVYGAGAPGNFGQLLRWLRTGFPLPLASVVNKRSLVGIDNLVDLIINCLSHPQAPSQTFLVSDGLDVSTTELLRLIGRALGKPVRLFPMPPQIIRTVATAFGMRDAAAGLLGSLQVDMEKTRMLLGWKPPVGLADGLKRAVRCDLK
jgi:UDP-glucose 4-epimerase